MIADVLIQAYPGVPFVINENESGYSLEWPEVEYPPKPTDAEIAAMVANYLPPAKKNWDGFNAYILGNPEFKATTATVRSTHPELVEALPSAYLLVGQGNPATFAFLMGQIYKLVSVSQAQRDTWADAARDVYNLPPDFVAVVRG